jgi:hypothetical protein
LIIAIKTTFLPLGPKVTFTALANMLTPSNIAFLASEPNLISFADIIISFIDRVIIRRIEEEKTTASGLIIPDAAAEKPLEGVIVAIGNGKKNDNNISKFFVFYSCRRFCLVFKQQFIGCL